MPKKPKYRPNRHQEPFFNWDFTVMEILREKPDQGSPSPLVSPINGDSDEDSSSSHEEWSNRNESQPFKTHLNQAKNYDLLDVPEPSLDNLSEDVLKFLSCLREENTSLRQEVRKLKEENIFQRQFRERQQASNDECVDMIVDLRERISFLESKTGSDHGSTVDGEDTSFKYLKELEEKRDECVQLQEDLDRFGNALKESRVKESLFECDVDFYKNEIRKLKKTIQELEGSQDERSVEEEKNCLSQSDPPKPTQHPEQSVTIFFVPLLKVPSTQPLDALSTPPSLPSVKSSSAPSSEKAPATVDISSAPSLQKAATPSSVKSSSVPSVELSSTVQTQSAPTSVQGKQLPSTDSPPVKSLPGPTRTSVFKTPKAKLDTKSFASIPKLNLSGINKFSNGWTEPIRSRESKSRSDANILPRSQLTPDAPKALSLPKLDLCKNLDQSGAEWTEQVRSRDIESPPRPKAPKFAKSLNFESKGVNPFSTTPIIAPGKKGKLKSTQSTPIFPPIKVRPDETIHQPKIIQHRKPEDITNTSGINRRGLILPDINLLSSDKTKIKTSGPSSCFVLPTRPSLTNKKEEKHVGQKKGVQDTGRKRNFRF